MIKSFRGVKQCIDGVNILEKENQRKNFRTILGYKKHNQDVVIVYLINQGL